MTSVASAFSTLIFNESQVAAIKNLKYTVTEALISENKHIRSSSLYLFSISSALIQANLPWLIPSLTKTILTFNQKLWNYSLYSALTESLELIVYKKENDSYAWHSDFRVSPQGHRKLSALLLLTNQTEYQGGELRFLENTGESIVDNIQQGTLIVYPSFLMHSITPLQEGKLEYLHLNWYGPPFK